MPKEIRIGDHVLYRCPDKGSAPLVDCYAECEQAGLVVASGDYIATLRATYNETNSPAWKYLRGFTSSIAGIGCLDSQPMIIVAHTNHPLMTSDVIRRFKADNQRKSSYGEEIILHPEEISNLIDPYKKVVTPNSDIFVLEVTSATNLILDDTVDATIDETKRTLLRPFLGYSTSLGDYLKGHINNRNSWEKNKLPQIGAFLNRCHFADDYMVFNHLWFGNNYIRGDLDGELHRENFFRYDSCVFGIEPKSRINNQ